MGLKYPAGARGMGGRDTQACRAGDGGSQALPGCGHSSSADPGRSLEVAGSDALVTLSANAPLASIQGAPPNCVLS